MVDKSTQSSLSLCSLFQAISKATILFQDEEELSEDWKKDLEQEKRL